ncbi:MAG: type II secretion system F family protein [Candidatus Riflebacteria bacterium]|nr:type II secretion system F family protein [Candidatus Riflebacteria bacterium]
MPSFTYKAYDRSGAECDGVVEAAEPGEARARLQAQGLTPFELTAGEAGAAPASFPAFSLGEAARFSRQLAALLRGGIPLARALASLEVQDGWSGRRPVLQAIREGIEKGRDLSAVLTGLGGVLDAWSLAVVRVGETTGRLDTAFGELADHLARQQEHRRRFLSAIAYPAVTFVVAAGVVAFLLGYLVPVVAQVFADLHGRLPWPTRLLIQGGALLKGWGLPALAVALAGWVAGRAALARPAWRRTWERCQQALPLWGPFLDGWRLEAWARNTGMMLRCGVSLLEVVRVARDSSDSELEREALTLVEGALEKGEPFAAALTRSAAFPRFVVQMVEAGETAGDLGGLLATVAGELEAENRTRTDLFLTLLEPLLIVVLGVVVGGIMVGVLLPVYEMNRLF